MDKKKLVEKMKKGEIGFTDDPEEENLAWEAFEKISGKNIEERKKELSEVARATLKKDKRISLLINERDLFELKTKANETGFSYQNLVGALIHNYVTGKISLTI